MRYNIQNKNNTRFLSDFFFNERKQNRSFHQAQSFNIIEDKKEFIIEIIAPGLKKEDFNIKIDKNQLNISVDKEADKVVNTKKVIRRDFVIGKLNKTFNLPNTVDLDKIEGSYDAGILTVSLPLKNEIVRNMSREINIS